MTNEQLAIKIKAGIDVGDNMSLLYEQMKGFIHTIAWRYRAYESIEDLEQEGYLALYDAIDGFDPDKGFKFTTYAENWISQRIRHYIANFSSSVRLPAYAQGRIREYKQLCDAFRKEYDRDPSDTEACYCMGLSLEQLDKVKKDVKAGYSVSLDSPLPGSEDGEITMGDTIRSDADVENMILEEIQAEQLKAVIWGCVDALEGRQPDIIRKKYQDGMTLQAIGEEYGITRETVRQQESKALRELRKPRNCKQLQPFIEEYIRSAAMVGVGSRRFRETWTSSTERVALRMLEHEEQLREYREMLARGREEVVTSQLLESYPQKKA